MKKNPPRVLVEEVKTRVSASLSIESRRQSGLEKYHEERRSTSAAQFALTVYSNSVRLAALTLPDTLTRAQLEEAIEETLATLTEPLTLADLEKPVLEDSNRSLDGWFTPYSETTYS